MDDPQKPNCDLTNTELSPPIPELSRRVRESSLASAGVLFTMLLCAATLFFGQFSFALNVMVDGEVVGTVPDTQALEELISHTEETVEYILGDTPDMADRVSYRLRLASSNTLKTLDTQEVEHAIISHIDGVEVQYVVTLDGEAVGHISSPDVLTERMDQRLADYHEDGAMIAAFLSDISFEQQVLSADTEMDDSALESLVSTLSVERIEQVTYVEFIPYVSTVIEDDTMFDDQIELLQLGIEGTQEVVALVKYVDDQVVGHTILQTKVLAPAVPEVILEGTQVRPLTASWGEYIWPAEGVLTSAFGPRWGSFHHGIDIAAPLGTPIWAADGGEVTFVGWFFGYGNLIRILHDNGHITYYGHLSRMDVAEGERVYRGQVIGGMGMTGQATGVHLHFEIRIDGIPVDPFSHLP